MICKLCLKEKTLVKSHIIPESFFEVKNREISPALIFDTDIHPKRRPIGIYDPNILCHECEKVFDIWDDYGFKLLVEKASERKILLTDEEGGWIECYEEYDYEKIRLFCLSVLWRAGVSDDMFFSHVKLGPYEERLRFLILNIPVTEDNFTIQFTRYSDFDQPVHMPPNPERYDGVRFYRFFLGRIMFHVKVDSRSTPHPFDKLIIQKDEPLYIMTHEFKTSSHAEIVKKVVSNPLNKNFFRR